MTDTDTFIIRAAPNGSLSALWFIAALLIVSGLITVAASNAAAAGGGIIIAGVFAMLLALTVQAIRFPRN